MITAITFLAAYIAGLGLCVWRHPVYGLYTYIAVFYLNPPSRWWAAELPDMRWSFVAAGVTLFVTLASNQLTPSRARWTSHGISRLLIAYVAWIWIQTIWAVDLDVHIQGVILFTKYLVVAYLIYTLIDTRDRAIEFLTVHAAGCFYFGVLSYFATYSDRLDGVGGPGLDDASSLGTQLAGGAFAAAAIFMAAPGVKRWAGALTIPFALNGVVLTASRGGFLGLVAGGLAFYVFGPPRRRAAITVAAFLGVGLFLYLSPAAFWERMFTIGNAVVGENGDDNSIQTRIALIPIQWRMTLDHPLGAGYDATTSLSFEYVDLKYQAAQGGRSSHNTLMSALVDQGFPGLLMWVSLIVMVCRRLLQVGRWAKRHNDEVFSWIIAAVGANYMTVLVSGFFAPFIAKEIYFWCLALVCSLTSMAVAAPSEQVQDLRGPDSQFARSIGRPS